MSWTGLASATGRIAVGPFVYVRFHGTQRYGGRYGEDELEAWASWLAARYAQTPQVFAYFNNDIGGHAPRDARLRVMLRAALGAAAPAIEI